MHESRSIFTAQFYPDANPGPRDTEVMYEGLLSDGLVSADVYQLVHQLVMVLNIGSGSVRILAKGPAMHRLVSA